MYSTRLAHLLLVVLSIVTFTQAAWFDFTLLQRSDGLVIRQDTNSSSAAAADDNPAASASATEAAPTTSEEEKTTKAEETTTQAPPPATTSDTPAPTTKDDPPAPTTTNDNNGGGATPASSPTSNVPTTQPTNGGSQPSSTNGGGGGNANPAPTASSNGDKTTAAPSTTAKPYTTVVTIFSTMENGDVSTAVSSSTVTPTLAQESSKNDNEGMSKETQNTIIGVCVGVGGAIVLAVAGLLIWRLRKRRQDQEDGEDLVNYGAGTSQFNSGGPEKMEPGGSVSGRSPFQSTLESYHAPAQSNTGTNF